MCRGAAQLGVDVVVADQRGHATVEAEAAQAHVDGRAQLVQAYARPCRDRTRSARRARGRRYDPGPWRAPGRRCSVPVMTTRPPSMSRTSRPASSPAFATRCRAAGGRWRSSSPAAVLDPSDDAVWERLEEALIHADCGVPATVAVIERLEAEAGAGTLATADQLTARLQEVIAELMAPAGRRPDRRLARAVGDPGRAGSTAPARRRRSARSPGTSARPGGRA